MMYQVFFNPEGSEEYLREAKTKREARRMAAEHAHGSRYGLPRSLYETARAAGHCNGVGAPVSTVNDDGEMNEPIEWFGRGGCYYITEA